MNLLGDREAALFGLGLVALRLDLSATPRGEKERTQAAQVHSRWEELGVTAEEIYRRVCRTDGRTEFSGRSPSCNYWFYIISGDSERACRVLVH